MDQKELEIAASQRENFDEMRGEIPVGHTEPEMPISREKLDEIAGTNPIQSGKN